MGPATAAAAGEATSNTGAGLHLLALLLLPSFIIPALALATFPTWWPALRHRRLCRGRQKGMQELPHPPPSLGLAAVYPLRWVYRDGDEWHGGLAALRLDARRPPSLVPLVGLLQPTIPPSNNGSPHWVIYCLALEAGAVVLIEIEPGADLLAEPFLDRGVRRLAGARAAVVRTGTLAAWVEGAYAEGGGGVNPLAGGVGWVWNTGRCGSTLLHRVLLAAGVCSLSEPYWLEQLARARTAGTLADGEETRHLLRLCLLADARLIAGAWMPQARVTSVNLKGLGHILLDLAHGLEGPDGRALFLGPGAVVRHLYMYRDMHPVVESLASVFHGHAPPSVRALLFLFPRWTLNLHWPPWSTRLRCWLGLHQQEGADSNGEGKVEAQFRAVAGSAALAVGEWGAGRALALSWLDSLATWQEATGAWAAGEKATLRMNEFIHPAGRPARLAAVLRFLLGEQAAQAILEDEDAVALCLTVFGVHSQQGNRMQRSSAVTGRCFLGPKTTARLQALLASVPDRHIASLLLPNALPMPSVEYGERRE